MNLLENPFYQLSATPRDTRERIAELADELSLLLDDVVATAARGELCTPRKRLAAEVAWLPGLSRSQTAELMSSLVNAPRQLLTQTHLPAITRVNLLLAGLDKMTDNTAEELSDWLFELVVVFETLNTEDLARIINEERVVSGFQEVTDLSALEDELSARKQYCRRVMTKALDQLPTKILINLITELVSITTHQGSKNSPQLIAELVDYYEIESQTFFAEEQKTVNILLEQITASIKQEMPDNRLSLYFTQLERLLENWNVVALPIQQHKKSLGLIHHESYTVAGDVRSLSITLFNDYYRIELAQKLTTMLLKFFSNIPEIIVRADEDAVTLKTHADEDRQRVRAEAQQQELRRQEITWEGEIGTLFKEKLRISPEGIFWKARLWPLDNITSLRWGGTRQSVNGIPTGTKYTIMFGDKSRVATIELRNKTIFTTFTDRLWRAVGVRILMDTLQDLQSGAKLRFGTALVSDFGVELERKRFMSSPERIFLPWSTVSIWNGAGAIFIGKKDDKQLSVALPYLDLDNINVLDAAVRLMLQNSGTKLSSLLQG